MPDPYCPNCKKPVGMVRLLKGVEAFDRGTISGVSKCPQCQYAIVFQVRNNRMTVGYIDGACFAGLYEVESRGLKCVRDKDGVRYIYKGVFYKAPMGK